MDNAGAERVVKAFCGRMCSGICGILVTVRDGRIASIKGDPESPFNRGRICAKGAALKDVIYHPERLKHPLVKRNGAWERTTWDEALSIVARKFSEAKARSGPESIALCTGSPKGFEGALVQRFASALGTPNVVTPGSICHMPRELAAAATYGAPHYPDLPKPPACLVVWGSNVLDTHEMGVGKAGLQATLDSSKLIVIDPRDSALTAKAALWLKPRPGSDGALALAMLSVIAGEGLHDREFVSKWTVGFDRLAGHVARFTPEWAEGITWVPAGHIREAARLYAATRPAAILAGNALEHNANSFQTCRAIAILRAITGNLDVPGGELLPGAAPVLRPGEFMLLKKHPRNVQKALGGEHKQAVRSMFSPSQSLVEAIIEEKPYPVKAVWVFGTNPVLSFCDSRRTLHALRDVDFLVVSDLFMTPTAELADVVLPAAAHLEFNDMGQYATRFGFVSARPKVVEPQGECRPDIMVINDLARKMGLGADFWENVEEAFDLVLKPAGLTYEKFKEAGLLKGGTSYRKYESKGFGTASGKVELCSKQLEEMGYAPLPEYVDVDESSKRDDARFPFVLTSAKPAHFYHSALRGVDSLRRLSPEPEVQVHPDIASKLGAKDGDWVSIETDKGSVRQRLKANSSLDQRVVIASFGWWYPEKPSAELYGWDASNVNILTDSSMPANPEIGSTFLRGIRCNLSRCD